MTEFDTNTQLHQAIDSWAAAERAGDTHALEALLTNDFTGIGPHGFALDKQQWLARYDSGDLVNEAFAAEDVSVRRYGSNAAVVNGVQAQQAAYRGRSFGGRHRLTMVLVNPSDAWAIANIQLSPMADQ